MNPYEKIQELTNERGISVRELEKRLGFSNGYFSKWKKVSPNSEGLQKVADYFDVSVDYLLGRTGDPKIADIPKVTDTDLDDILDGVMSFRGGPLTDKDREAVRAFLEGRKSK
ncbi:helix-turn-helix transcriptional regulator [Enterococcus asini]|uniref:helix-turn-helix domain-containing protein n=1 Tax=Enterococcus asini TaxID=57732 RepID=UPI0032E370E2